MSYGTISYNGFVYRIRNNIGENAVKTLVGDAVCYPVKLPYGEYENLRYKIENERLVLASAILCIDIKDFDKVIKNSSFKPQYEKITSVCEKDGDVQLCERYMLKFFDISIDVNFSGKVSANQLYVDEQDEESGSELLTPSLFSFKKGSLISKDSMISSSTKTKIEKYIWRDELAGKPQNKFDTSKRIYYISPTGSIAQNDYLISAVINYLSKGFLEEKIIVKLLSFKQIILRVDFMEETDCERGIFEKRSCDLITAAAKRFDLQLLERLSPYIEFSKFADYSVKLTSVIIENLEKAMDSSDKELILKCRKMVEILKKQM